MWSASCVGDSVRSLSIAVWSVDGRRCTLVARRLSTAWSTAARLRPASTCNASAASARAALAIVIDNVVRLLAPYLPYVTEEVWSWYREGSVHTAPWPVVADLAGVEGDPSALEAASSALIALRRVKSEAKMSPRTPFLAVTVRAPQAQVEALESVKGDLEAASKAVGALTVGASDGAYATEASIESFELGGAPAKRKG